MVLEWRTFALWRVLAAVSEYVDLIDGSVRLEQLLQLLLRPGARDLAHEHLDGVRVRLVRMLQRPVHLPGRAVAVNETGDAELHRGESRQRGAYECDDELQRNGAEPGPHPLPRTSFSSAL